MPIGTPGVITVRSFLNWGLVLYKLDGSGKQVVAPNGNLGALSPTGQKVAYAETDHAIHIVQVSTQAEQILPKASGLNLQCTFW